jgi:hypothetical protein
VTKLTTALLALFVAFLSFTGTALAASAADAVAEGSLFDLAKPVLDAVRSGNGWLAAALALVLLVGVARKYLAPRGGRWAWLGSKAGGALCNVLLGLGGMLATAFTAGTLPSWGLLLTSLKVSVVAAGGFTLIKDLAAPALRWLEGKAPAWARPWIAPVFKLLLWPFEQGGAAKVAKAEAAGKAATEAKPAQGTAAITGPTDELP